MKALFSKALVTAAVLAVSAPAFAGQPETHSAPAATGAVAVAVAPQADTLATAVPEVKDAPMADPRFAPYCLKYTGSVIVAAQNRRAERHARWTGTAPKLRCTATGVALKVNPDGVPVPDQGAATRSR